MRHPMIGPSFSLRASVAAAFLVTGLGVGAASLLRWLLGH